MLWRFEWVFRGYRHRLLSLYRGNLGGLRRWLRPCIATERLPWPEDDRQYNGIQHQASGDPEHQWGRPFPGFVYQLDLLAQIRHPALPTLSLGFAKCIKDIGHLSLPHPDGQRGYHDSGAVPLH